jgi:hypothetical protein
MEEQFTRLGTGQAFVTVLNEKGIPTETVVTHLAPPASVMGPLPAQVYQQLIEQSEANRKYRNPVDPQSAFELLDAKMKSAPDEAATPTPGRPARAEKSTFEEVLASPMARQVGRELVRGVFGMLFGSTPRRRSSRRSLF